MKLAVVLGSNRESGFSSKLIKYIEEECHAFASVKVIWLRDYKISLCDADNACANKICGIDDDMKVLLDLILDVDAILYVPVVHAYGTCSRMQAFIERLGYGYLRPLGRPLHNKLAMVAPVGRRYSHENVFSQLTLNLLLNRCIIVGSGFPPCFRSEKADPKKDKEAWDSLRAGLHRMFMLNAALNKDKLEAAEEAHFCQFNYP